MSLSLRVSFCPSCSVKSRLEPIGVCPPTATSCSGSECVRGRLKDSDSSPIMFGYRAICHDCKCKLPDQEVPVRVSGGDVSSSAPQLRRVAESPYAIHAAGMPAPDMPREHIASATEGANQLKRRECAQKVCLPFSHLIYLSLFIVFFSIIFFPLYI